MIRFLALAALVLLSACGGGEETLPEETACFGGGYRLEDGRVVGMIPRGDGDIRYQFFSGETGGIYRGDDGIWRSNDGDVAVDLGACGSTAITFTMDGTETAGTRLPYIVTETIFDGVDGKRAGRLVLPADQPTKAIIVSVHGSERWSGRTGGRLQSIMPAFGIGVFAYDKRGTGASEGKYTQHFGILSGDAIRARNEARRLFGEEIPIGYLGGSQGGWVAPYAASQDDAAFVIAAYGMAISPAMEDEEEVVHRLREAGYGEDVIEKAREITAATRKIIRSDFKEGFKELSDARKKYKNEPWYDEIYGEYTRDLLNAPNIGIRIVGPFRAGLVWPWKAEPNTPNYQPRPVIESLDVPQLWILAEDDRAAPSATTLEILRDVQTTNGLLDVVVFPDTDHGMVEFTEDEDGERTYTRVTEGYYALIRDYVLTGEPTLSVTGPVVYRRDAAAEAPE
ncbi:MAG: alpha/beta hydrolase [Pseudomonadota bacterium]